MKSSNVNWREDMEDPCDVHIHCLHDTGITLIYIY